MRVIKSFFILWLNCLGSLYIYAQHSNSVPARDTTAPRFDSLKAVIVTAALRPRLRGDTLEYNVENLLSRKYSVVEDLLRRLPGLQIDINGNISYNGEKIQHLLVDGEDIFGSDPTMVTRSFDASKIAKIQILDRKSDRALFTGIDDGSRTKTLNLVLKENARNGFFGQTELGGNTDRYYSANGMLAGFRDKEQLTAFAVAGNTGITKFSGITFLNGNADALGASAGTGIPQFEAAALHYANAWDGSRDHLVTTYQYSYYFTQPVTTTRSVENLLNSIYGQQQQNHSTNQQNQHWVYGTYDFIPNKKIAFKFGFHLSSSNAHNQFWASGNSTLNDTTVNSSQRTIGDEVRRTNAGGDISWRVQIGNHIERTFSVYASLTKVDITSEGQLYSINRFYQQNGTVQSSDTVDQRKNIATHSISIVGGIGYTEPLWRDAVLGLSYSLSFIRDAPLQATYGLKDGKYDELIDSLSSHFQTRTANQSGVISLRGRIKKLTYTIGGSWLYYEFRQRDLSGDSISHLHYVNWTPRASLNYVFSPEMGINFAYSGSTQQPSIAQLQPVKNNSDPLHITLGNPYLHPAFIQDFKLDFHRIKTWIWGGDIHMTLSTNAISIRTLTDSLGRQISQPVNVDGGKAVNFNFFVHHKVLSLDVGLNGNSSYTRNINYVNADLSRNNAFTNGGGFTITKYAEDKYSLQLSTNISYFNEVSSINPDAPIHYWLQNHSGSFTIYLLRNFEINTNGSYTWQEKTSDFGSNTSVFLWNSYIVRNFLQSKLAVKFQLNNILNNNSGISRTNVNNVNTESFTNILGRYWIVSAIYRFDGKFNKK